MLTNENINAGPIGSAASCDVPAHANPCSNANPTLLTTRVLWPVANRNWGDLNALAPDKPSYYDALQTKLMRRFSGGSSIGSPSHKYSRVPLDMKAGVGTQTCSERVPKIV